MRQNKIERNRKKCVAFMEKNFAFEGKTVLMCSNEAGWVMCVAPTH